MPPPNLYYHRAQQPPPEPRFGVVADMLKVLLSLALLGGAGWTFYHFYWSRRLTEEHDLTDRQGKVVRAHLEGRTNSLLKYISLDNNLENLVPISDLSADDQAYVQQLPPAVNLDCPINCVFTDPAGQPMRVTIVRRTGSWLKYTVASDGSSHYAAISALPAADQKLVRQFPPPHLDRYPAEYMLPDASGQPQEVRIIGRNDNFVVYQTIADEQTHFELLNSLPDADQPVVRQLQNYISVQFPLEATLTDLDGHKIHGIVNGRSNDVMKFTLTGEDKPRYYLMSSFSVTDQQILRLMPLNFTTLQFPLEMMLSDQAGHSMPVRITHRSDTLVQFVSLADNNTHLYPLSMLSSSDQAVLQYSQPLSTFRYPLETSLTDEKGAILKVRFEGRTAESVIYTTLLDNIKHIAPLTQLSALDRTVLQMIPTDAPDATESQGIKDIRTQIDNLTAEDDSMQKEIDRLAPNDAERESMQRRIAENKSKIDSLTYEMDVESGKAR